MTESEFIENPKKGHKSKLVNRIKIEIISDFQKPGSIGYIRTLTTQLERKNIQ